MCARGVTVFEERQVDQARTVVQGGEDDPAPRPDRRGLGGGLGTRDQDALPVLGRPQPPCGDRAQLLQERVVALHQMVREIHAEDTQLGAEAFLVTEIGQTGRCQLLPRALLHFADIELAAVRGHPPPHVQFGEIQQQITAVRAERVQRTDLSESLGDRFPGRARCQKSSSEE